MTKRLMGRGDESVCCLPQSLNPGRKVLREGPQCKWETPQELLKVSKRESLGDADCTANLGSRLGERPVPLERQPDLEASWETLL